MSVPPKGGASPNLDDVLRDVLRDVPRDVPRDVLRMSRFVARAVAAQPTLAEETSFAEVVGWDRAAMEHFLAAQPMTDADTLGSALRRLRQRVLIRLATRDLTGVAPLAEVHSTMSDLADVAICAAHRFWTRALEAEIGVPYGGRTDGGRTARHTTGGDTADDRDTNDIQSGDDNTTVRGNSETRQELLVIGMGKLGGRELNVSSDIDLIFIYPDEGETHGPKKRPTQEFFTRLGQRIIATLDEVTGDGRVFRVDMRLRPWGDGGALVASFAALENYLMVHGREWERYAWIKARVVAGGVPWGVAGAQVGAAVGAATGAQAGGAVASNGRNFRDELHNLVRPFVYRRYLDYGALGSLRELHAQIRHEGVRRDFAEHVKLGPGGIREIEFIAQAIQLIRAGRDRSLQLAPTLAVLRLLAIKGHLDATLVRELVGAYTFLRRLEHRLQYLDDEQTHTLPRVSADRLLIARSMGYASTARFMAALNHHRDAVSRHFAAIFKPLDEANGATPSTAGSSAANPATNLAANPPSPASAPIWSHVVSGALAPNLTAASGAESGNPDDNNAAIAALNAAGFAQPQEALRQLHELHSGARYRALPAASQSRLDRLMPHLIAAAAATRSADNSADTAADTALTRTLELVETVSGRSAYLALLEERRDALSRVTNFLAASSWAAHYLNRHPILLDELLDPRIYSEVADPRVAAERFAAALREALLPHTLPHADDVERQMDVMRELHHAQVFRLLVQDLEGLLPVEALADHLSALADVVLTVTIEQCWARLLTRHRDTPRFAVISYGKLGGKELGYASDLDLAFVFDDDDPRAAEIYARLAQRMVTWLSSRTGAGQLFETDLRLRPNGEAGLLVVSLEAFEKYQRESAWSWEHQALTRARFCAGDATVGSRFETLRNAILKQARDAITLRAEIVAMRERMAQAHPNRSGLFDVKHGRGAMIDIEFATQFLVLAHAKAQPQLTGNLGNIALLKIAADLGLISTDTAAGAREAYREFRRVQHRLRLNDAPFARVPFETVAVHAEAGRQLWNTLFGPRVRAAAKTE